jgi:hypothetical protein
MALTRIRAFIHSTRLERQIRSARRRELAALARAGERLAATGNAAELGRPELLKEIGALASQVESWTSEISRSLAGDRADFARVSPWVRPLVVARGLSARAVLRHLRHRHRVRLRPLYVELGAAAISRAESHLSPYHLPPDLAETMRRARADEGARAAQQAGRYGAGERVPAVLGALPQEGKAFGLAFVKQLQSQLFPRVPALAGLAVGWWIARTYTDSRWRSVLRSIGIGDGGTRVVDSDTLQAMNFWLPLLAAAICAYLGDRIARSIRRHYQAPSESG